MKSRILARNFFAYATVSFSMIGVGVVQTSCSDDLLTGTPSWLGESIYEELESRGNFKTTLELINAQSEDYASVLKKTGSKTIFVSDDDAWAKFFENNSWNVKSISDMTEAQKRMLFKSNMINSAYLVELLGNIPSSSSDADPIEGGCIRRTTSLDVMDSVPHVVKSQFPTLNPVRLDGNGDVIDFWSRVRGKDTILMLQDNNVPTMIHFMPKFMSNNNITDDDVDFLTNHEISTNSGAFVNGKVIKERDITCQNGYIHILDGVSVPMDNMANVIANQPQFSIYSRLLDRFSYPSYNASLSEEYQRQYGGNDCVFVKRYFNNGTANSLAKRDDNDGGASVSTQLPYDPGWNKYYLQSSVNAYGSDAAYMVDAAVMLVPTDEALINYLQNDGSDLNERYAKAGPGETAWDNAPDKVVLPLLKNTMLVSLKSAIPSQFASINNTASEPMGVEKKDIDYVHWACNGVVYETNKVYVAPEYVSVFYPCVIRGDEDLKCVYTVVDNDNKVAGGEGFYAYLNNMGSDYSFIIPSDNALQTYYDPVSCKRTNNKNESTSVGYKFFINESGYIDATVPLVNWADVDEWGHPKYTGSNYTTAPTTSTESKGDVFNHFKDILNSSLAVGLFTPGRKFYNAKNGGPIIVEWSGDAVTGVAGSFQFERGYYIPVSEIFDKSTEGNGRSYIVDKEPLMSTTTSPYAALNDSNYVNQFGAFAELLDGMDIINTGDGSSHLTMDKCLTNLNNYNYTIYVPNNDSIKALMDAHLLPTWDDIDDINNCLTGVELSEDDELYLTEQKQKMQDVINNFVNYHIQDNSLYIDGEEYSNGVFESACLDTTTNRFVKLYVSYTRGGRMTVTDNVGNVRTVDQDYNNILTRQYYFSNKAGSTVSQMSDATEIYSSSFAVIHQINAPLVAGKNSYYSPSDYAKVRKILDENPINGTETETPNPIKRYKR